MDIQGWQDSGSRVSINGRSLFVRDSDADGGSGKPALVILHGYPTSSHDYHMVFEGLAREFRVVVHDHVGFGLSDKPRDYSYSIFEQADMATALWQRLGLESIRVFAHDYGTSIATELLARANEGSALTRIESMVLCNGSVHIELARLRLIQKLLRNHVSGPLVARMTNQRVFNRNMRKLWHDGGSLSSAELDGMWHLLTRDGGKAVLPRITQYLRDRVTYWDRWVGALQQATIPLGFLWGSSDPIVGAGVARVHHEEAPGSVLTLLENVGHYPMLEAPEMWKGALIEMQQSLVDHEG